MFPACFIFLFANLFLFLQRVVDRNKFDICSFMIFIDTIRKITYGIWNIFPMKNISNMLFIKGITLVLYVLEEILFYF